MMMRYQLEAPAKVNLFLGVQCECDGSRHLLQSVFQAISLHDTLEVEVEPDAFLPGISIENRFEPGITAVNVPLEDNLVYRAANQLAVLIDHPLTERFDIRLHKRIPVQAGLGGGSSDCAAMLVLLAQLWGLDLQDDAIQKTASSLGSDINFFFEGGCALFDRYGDRFVEQVPARPLSMVLAKPEYGISTGAVYRAFDQSPAVAGSSDALICALSDADANCAAPAYIARVAAALSNNLTDAALRIEPELAETFATMKTVMPASEPLLSGSGAAVFALCDNERAAEDGAAELRRRGLWAVAARSSEGGVRNMTASPSKA